MKHRRKNILGISIVILLLGGVLYWFFAVRGNASLSENTSLGLGGERGTVENIGGAQKYTSEGFGFSFNIPNGYTVGEFDEGGGRVVLVNAPEGGETFQLFISSFGESPESLTPERIQEDVPGLSIREPEELSMTGGQKVLTFIGEDATFGVTREVWMVHKGNLFQIVTPISTQDALATLLESWELF